MGMVCPTERAQKPADLAIGSMPRPADGPVLIQIEYLIDPAVRERFLQAIQKVGPTLSTGAAPLLGSSTRQVRSCAEPG